MTSRRVLSVGVMLVSFLLGLCPKSGYSQTPTSNDTQTAGCGQLESDKKIVGASKQKSALDSLKQILQTNKDRSADKKIPEDVIISAIQGHISTLNLTPGDIADLSSAGASPKLLMTLTSGSEVYIGWSVLPSKILRDNYGRHIMSRYFGIDVVIANRSGKSADPKEDSQSLIVTALEFCHVQSGGELRDVSIDPVLVRGSLQKGELTGRRNVISRAIQATGGVASPSAGFFKNELHRGTFSTAAALFTPLKTGFDLVWPDTILTYLENWDKDEVFKKGFVVAAGGSARGRIFIPIEIIYPRPLKERAGLLSAGGKKKLVGTVDEKKKLEEDEEQKKKLEEDNVLWKQATKGNYDPEDVKKKIGTLVVLGQEISLGARRRYVKGGETRVDTLE